jgi:hypothetical protein
VIKKKKDATEPPPPAAPAEEKIRNPNGANLQRSASIIPWYLSTSACSWTKRQQFVPGLKPAQFLVLEDGVEQKVDNVRMTQTPITAVMLLEFAANSYWGYIQTMQQRVLQLLPVASAGRLRRGDHLRPEDPHPERLYEQQGHVLGQSLQSLLSSRDSATPTPSTRSTRRLTG